MALVDIALEFLLPPLRLDDVRPYGGTLRLEGDVDVDVDVLPVMAKRWDGKIGRIAGSLMRSAIGFWSASHTLLRSAIVCSPTAGSDPLQPLMHPWSRPSLRLAMAFGGFYNFCESA